MSWTTLFLSPGLIGMYTNNFTLNWAWYLLLTWLPIYLHNQLGFDVKTSGAVAVLPYCGTTAGFWVAGCLSDLLIRRYGWSVVSTRKFMMGITGGVPALCLTLIGLVDMSGGSIVTLSADTVVGIVTAGLFFASFSAGGSNLVALDLFPASAGMVYGVSNTFGSIPGMTSPLLTGFILEGGNCSVSVEDASSGPPARSCTDAWGTIFLIAAGMYLLGAVVFVGCAGRDKGYQQISRQQQRARPTGTSPRG